MSFTPAPRPYPNLLRAVVDGLEETFLDGRYADQVVADLLKRDSRWGSRDRAFIAETLYDIVRWKRLLAHVADDERAPYLLAAYWWWRYGQVLATAELPHLDAPTATERLAFAKTIRALRESIPDWLDLLGLEELGDAWEPTMSALNEPAFVYLRTNFLKTDRDTLVRELNADGFRVEADDRTPEGIRVLERRNLWATRAFKAGFYEVQDIGSQRVSHGLQVEPGMTVIDACAGAGGKTLHLAALMRNTGTLIALDTDGRKLTELKRRARRAGVQNLETRLITSSKVVKRLTDRADRLLLDVPCSGLGVLRRNPDAKWKLQPGFLGEVRSWQTDILERYPRMVGQGGKVVYATCSILPSEGEAQVAKYLAAHADRRLEASERLSPLDRYDGFYWARLSARAEAG